MEIICKIKKTVDFDKFLTENGLVLKIDNISYSEKNISMALVDPNSIFNIRTKTNFHVDYITNCYDGGISYYCECDNDIRLISTFAAKISDNKLYIYKKTHGNEMNPATFLKVIEIPKLSVTESMFTIKYEYF